MCVCRARELLKIREAATFHGGFIPLRQRDPNAVERAYQCAVERKFVELVCPHDIVCMLVDGRTISPGRVLVAGPGVDCSLPLADDDCFLESTFVSPLPVSFRACECECLCMRAPSYACLPQVTQCDGNGRTPLHFAAGASPAVTAFILSDQVGGRFQVRVFPCEHASTFHFAVIEVAACSSANYHGPSLPLSFHRTRDCSLPASLCAPCVAWPTLKQQAGRATAAVAGARPAPVCHAGASSSPL